LEAVLVVRESRGKDRCTAPDRSAVSEADLNPLSFVSAEQTYLVRRSDSQEREYRLHELTWLWRNRELPPDAEFRDASGAWRPVRILVEPLLDATCERKNTKAIPPAARPAHAAWWVIAGLTVLAVAFALWPDGRRRYDDWKNARSEERRKMERERTARTADFLRSNDIIPGMIPEEVRRIIGPPRAMNATGDGGVQRWIYRKQVVVFENGKVIGVEASE